MQKKRGEWLRHCALMLCILAAPQIAFSAPPALESLAAKLAVAPAGTTSTVQLNLPLPGDGRLVQSQIRVRREGNKCEADFSLTWPHAYEFRGVSFRQRNRSQSQTSECRNLASELPLAVAQLMNSMQSEILGGRAYRAPRDARQAISVSLHSSGKTQASRHSRLWRAAPALRLQLSARLALVPLPARGNAVAMSKPRPSSAFQPRAASEIRVALLGRMQWPMY